MKASRLARAARTCWVARYCSWVTVKPRATRSSARWPVTQATPSRSGNWLLVYNDTRRGRNSLAVSLSADEGVTWQWTRHLESQERGSYHYPAVIQAKDGSIHAAYSYFVAGGKSMKHARFNEAWVKRGD